MKAIRSLVFAGIFTLNFAAANSAYADMNSDSGVIDRKSGSVILLNDQSEEVARYNFFETWPCRQVVGSTNTPAPSGGSELSQLEKAATIEMLHRVSEMYFKLAQQTGNESFGVVAKTLAKLTVQPEKGDTVQVMFNPREYSLSKATPWKHPDMQGLDAPTLKFTSGEPYRTHFELFFDRYEEGKSIREITDKIESFAKINQELHRPPTALLSLGTDLAFQCTMQNFSLQFTLFLPDGTPVRATMNTVWKKFSPAENQLKTNPRH